ncbi:ferrochelatase [Paenibacillus sp.]|uniref:ferrochelatase n=1 Tax=Paenibacillus sp. TaxID=58172 RepID=UPI002D50E1A4|nr:ferrochelatase [Paenibacillus sp.]HZG87068.1 ferrochelatase [Paenibacillus sp.]
MSESRKYGPDAIGVLVMSYGTPESLDQVEAYYTHIRRGRPPTKEQLDDLIRRYDTIVGGFFPLRRNTDLQVAALQETLDRTYPDAKFVCYQGQKHASPFIEDGVRAMAADGITRAVGVVLAPHYSSMSVGGYIKRAKETAEEAGVAMEFVESYHLHPKFIEAVADRLERALKKFTEVDPEEVKVLFTAHSLPERILQMNDPYPEQLLASSRAAAERAGIENWQFAWQSAGQTNEPWLGPDVLEELERLHADEGVDYALVCPIGFVSDHLEVLYDLDIEAQALARKLGMHLERTDMLNTEPLYMETLADVVGESAKRLGAGPR